MHKRGMGPPKLLGGGRGCCIAGEKSGAGCKIGFENAIWIIKNWICSYENWVRIPDFHSRIPDFGVLVRFTAAARAPVIFLGRISRMSDLASIFLAGQGLQL